MDWVRLTQTHKDLAGLGGGRPRRDITLEEVALHCTREDAWTVLRGKVGQGAAARCLRRRGRKRHSVALGLPSALRFAWRSRPAAPPPAPRPPTRSPTRVCRAVPPPPPPPHRLLPPGVQPHPLPQVPPWRRVHPHEGGWAGRHRALQQVSRLGERRLPAGKVPSRPACRPRRSSSPAGGSPAAAAPAVGAGGGSWHRRAGALDLGWLSPALPVDLLHLAFTHPNAPQWFS